MCTFYIMLLIYAKILSCLKGNEVFFQLWSIDAIALNSHKFFQMEQQKKYTGVYWLLFFLSTAGFVAAIAMHFEYLTLILPFVCTFFVKAMDIM